MNPLTLYDLHKEKINALKKQIHQNFLLGIISGPEFIKVYSDYDIENNQLKNDYYELQLLTKEEYDKLRQPLITLLRYKQLEYIVLNLFINEGYKNYNFLNNKYVQTLLATLHDLDHNIETNLPEFVDAYAIWKEKFKEKLHIEIIKQKLDVLLVNYEDADPYYLLDKHYRMHITMQLDEISQYITLHPAEIDLIKLINWVLQYQLDLTVKTTQQQVNKALSNVVSNPENVSQNKAELENLIDACYVQLKKETDIFELSDIYSALDITTLTEEYSNRCMILSELIAKMQHQQYKLITADRKTNQLELLLSEEKTRLQKQWQNHYCLNCLKETAEIVFLHGPSENLLVVRRQLDFVNETTITMDEIKRLQNIYLTVDLQKNIQIKHALLNKCLTLQDKTSNYLNFLDETILRQIRHINDLNTKLTTMSFGSINWRILNEEIRCLDIILLQTRKNRNDALIILGETIIQAVNAGFYENYTSDDRDAEIKKFQDQIKIIESNLHKKNQLQSETYHQITEIERILSKETMAVRYNLYNERLKKEKLIRTHRDLDIEYAQKEQNLYNFLINSMRSASKSIDRNQVETYLQSARRTTISLESQSYLFNNYGENSRHPLSFYNRRRDLFLSDSGLFKTTIVFREPQPFIDFEYSQKLVSESAPGIVEYSAEIYTATERELKGYQKLMADNESIRIMMRLATDNILSGSEYIMGNEELIIELKQRIKYLKDEIEKLSGNLEETLSRVVFREANIFRKDNLKIIHLYKDEINTINERIDRCNQQNKLLKKLETIEKFHVKLLQLRDQMKIFKKSDDPQSNFETLKGSYLSLFQEIIEYNKQIENLRKNENERSYAEFISKELNVFCLPELDAIRKEIQQYQTNLSKAQLHAENTTAPPKPPFNHTQVIDGLEPPTVPPAQRVKHALAASSARTRSDAFSVSSNKPAVNIGSRRQIKAADVASTSLKQPAKAIKDDGAARKSSGKSR